MLIALLLGLSILASLVAVPVVAAFILWLAPEHQSRIVSSWLGLSIGLGLATTVPLYSVLVGLEGPRWEGAYSFSPLFGLAALAIGVIVVRSLLARLQGSPPQRAWPALLCLAFAVAVATALLPLVFGARMPFGGGEFNAEWEIRGDGWKYLHLVAPLALAMIVEAWLLWPALGSTAPAGGTLELPTRRRAAREE